MPLLIDTYNVLHITGILPPDLAGLDTAALAHLLPRTRYREDTITLVCDGAANPTDPGHPPPGRFAAHPRITIRYSGHGVTADAWIIDAVERSSAPKRLTIVSTDREILRAARKRRCITLTSTEFLQQLTADLTLTPVKPAKPAPSQQARDLPPARMKQKELTAWKAMFGLSASAGDDSTTDDAAPVADEPPAIPARLRDYLPDPAEAAGAMTTPIAGAAPEDADADAASPDDPSAPHIHGLPQDIIEEAQRLIDDSSSSGGAEPPRP